MYYNGKSLRPSNLLLFKHSRYYRTITVPSTCHVVIVFPLYKNMCLLVMKGYVPSAGRGLYEAGPRHLRMEKLVFPLKEVDVYLKAEHPGDTHCGVIFHNMGWPEVAYES